MKIITKCIIDIETLEVIKEESFNYYGPLIKCKGGGGGGAGVVDYPQYMKDFQGDLLNHSGIDKISESIVVIMNSALTNSPYSSTTAFDPDIHLSSMDAAISALAGLIPNLNTTWDGFNSKANTDFPNLTPVSGITDATIVADVTAFSNQLDDEISTKVIPRFEAGMHNINAVTSSAFAIGISIIEAFKARDVAKHNSALRLAAADHNSKIEVENNRVILETVRNRISAINTMINTMSRLLGAQEALAHSKVEVNRIEIVAKKEETDSNESIAVSDASWDLEVLQHGGNILASIGGGVMTANKKKNVAASVLGGAMTGAAAGAMYGASEGSMVSPGWGTVIGGILGAAIGLFS